MQQKSFYLPKQNQRNFEDAFLMKHRLFKNEISFTKLMNRKKRLFKSFIEEGKNPNDEFLRKMSKKSLAQKIRIKKA